MFIRVLNSLSNFNTVSLETSIFSIAKHTRIDHYLIPYLMHFS
ncbi:hypothetical protein [Cytobacillus depressus]|nr:hypothetical protein [Cytobacillus depressus]